MIPEKTKLEFTLKAVTTGELSQTPLGLINGYSGVILLLAHYYVVTKKAVFLDNMLFLINFCIKYINTNQQKIDLTLGFGLTGFCHSLSIINCLKEQSIPCFDKILNDLDSLFLESLERKKIFFHLDHFNGINGFINYAIERPNLSPIIINYLNFFYSKHDLDHLWNRKIDGVEYTNMGVPHGISGTLLLINKLTRRGHEFSKNFESLLIDFLLSQNKIESGGGFYFPGRVVKNNPSTYYNSQLGWCYGDLPTGLALYEFSKARQLQQLKQFSLVVLENTLSKTNASTDNTLCHGYISIVNLYEEIYKKTFVL